MGDSRLRRDGRTMHIGDGQLEVRSENGLATLTLRGAFDMANVADLDAAVQQELSPAADAIVDLRDVTFMDARLLRWLVSLRRDLHARGGRLLVRPGDRALRVFGLLAVDEPFEMVEG
jgi:anti-anti-sigma factor